MGVLDASTSPPKERYALAAAAGTAARVPAFPFLSRQTISRRPCCVSLDLALNTSS